MTGGSKRILIAGITGQDGAYLAHYLLNQRHTIYGTSRDPQTCDLSRLERLGIRDSVTIVSMTPSDFRSVLGAVAKTTPDEIYNLSGLTSVGLSFEQPVECQESISTATLNFLEVIRFLDARIKYFNAGSSECFGSKNKTRANETTPLNPSSPYAIAKSTAYWHVDLYRKAYGLHACTGILGNHESPLRPSRFVTQKIIEYAQNPASPTSGKLILGNLDIWRDWGWAPDYVEAMHLMLQSKTPKDYIIASGSSSSLRDFVGMAFQLAGMDAQDNIETSPDLFRPADLKHSLLDPGLIRRELGWKADKSLSEVVEKMFCGDLF